MCFVFKKKKIEYTSKKFLKCLKGWKPNPRTRSLQRPIPSQHICHRFHLLQHHPPLHRSRHWIPRCLACHMSRERSPLQRWCCLVPLDQRRQFHRPIVYCSPLNFPISPYQSLRWNCFSKRRSVHQNDNQPHHQRLSFTPDPFSLCRRRHIGSFLSLRNLQSSVFLGWVFRDFRKFWKF